MLSLSEFIFVILVAVLVLLVVVCSLVSSWSLYSIANSLDRMVRLGDLKSQILPETPLQPEPTSEIDPAPEPEPPAKLDPVSEPTPQKPEAPLDLSGSDSDLPVVSPTMQSGPGAKTPLLD